MKPEIKDPGLSMDVSRMRKLNQVDFIGIHHTAVAHNQSVQTIHNFHVNTNGWAGIGYHYYIEQDGTIYKGRPDNKRGAHIRGENYRSLGVCVAGNFDVQDIQGEFPKQYKALVKLLIYLIAEYPGVKIKRHTDFDQKTCPGTNFPFEELKEDVRKVKEVDDTLSKYFKDMKASHEWGADHVDKLYEEDLISGKSEDEFSPDEPISRLECAVLINRLREYMIERLG